MTAVKRYERVLKDLGVLANAANGACLQAAGLKNKVAGRRVERHLREARRAMRLDYYEFEVLMADVQG